MNEAGGRSLAQYPPRPVKSKKIFPVKKSAALV